MTKKIIFKNIFINLIAIAISFILGFIFKDYWLGSITLACGFLNAYYMAIGKWQNYIYGLMFCITYAIACFLNGLYGCVIFTILIYVPIQITGILNWLKNKQKDTVLVNSLNFKKSILICTLLIASSALIGFLLSLIPSQNLAFLDSTSQMINICGLTLVILRYREAWYIWIFNNIIDLSIWTINIIKNTQFSQLMFLVSIMYLIMNIIGIIRWIKMEHDQKNAGKMQIDDKNTDSFDNNSQ